MLGEEGQFSPAAHKVGLDPHVPPRDEHARLAKLHQSRQMRPVRCAQRCQNGVRRFGPRFFGMQAGHGRRRCGWRRPKQYPRSRLLAGGPGGSAVRGFRQASAGQRARSWPVLAADALRSQLPSCSTRSVAEITRFLELWAAPAAGTSRPRARLARPARRRAARAFGGGGEPPGGRLRRRRRPSWARFAEQAGREK